MVSLLNVAIITVVLFVGIGIAGYGVYILMELVDCTDKCFGPPAPLTEAEKEDVEMVMLENSTKPYEGEEQQPETTHKTTTASSTSTFSVDDDTNDDEDEEDDDENTPCCSICLENYVAGDPILRPACCATTFHAECFRQWRATAAENSPGDYTKCPHCRQLHMYTMDQWKHAAGAVLGKRRTRGIAVPRSVQQQQQQ